MIRSVRSRQAGSCNRQQTMTRNLFGTDGIRGSANSAPMTPDSVLKIAMAAGRCFAPQNRHSLAVIGKDTRLSGYMLEPAMVAGFTAIGMDVVPDRPDADPGGRHADAIIARRSRGHVVGVTQSLPG